MNNTNEEKRDEVEVSVAAKACQSQERREALKKLGKFAAYTAPTVLGITVSQSAAAS